MSSKPKKCDDCKRRRKVKRIYDRWWKETSRLCAEYWNVAFPGE